MEKFWKIISTIVKIILIVALSLSTVYLALCSYDVQVDNSFTVRKGSFAKNPIWLEDGEETPVDTIYDSYADDKAEMTYQIYELICKKFMLSPVYGSRAKSYIKAWTGDSYDDPEGIAVNVTNNNAHQCKTVGTPELNANQKRLSSYTNSIYLTDCSVDAMKGALKEIIQFADRGYSDGNKAYKQKGKLSFMEDGDEVFDWNGEVKLDNATAKRVYEDDDIRDIDSFIVNRDTILPDSCEVERVFDAEYKMNKYTVRFSLDCSDVGEGCATYYEVSAVKDLLGSFMKGLYYDRLDIEMQLYANGYLLERRLVQDWTVTVNFFSLKGHASSELEEVFNYKANECRIVEIA